MAAGLNWAPQRHVIELKGEVEIAPWGLTSAPSRLLNLKLIVSAHDDDVQENRGYLIITVQWKLASL